MCSQAVTMYVHSSIHPSIHPSIFPSIHPFIHRAVCSSHVGCVAYEYKVKSIAFTRKSITTVINPDHESDDDDDDNDDDDDDKVSTLSLTDSMLYFSEHQINIQFAFHDLRSHTDEFYFVLPYAEIRGTYVR
jgi:hypothetical protein